MMKKFLLALSLFFCFGAGYAQSISLLDLANLTSLTTEQIDDYFIAGKMFKLDYGEQVNGFVVRHYKTSAGVKKLETVLAGGGYKTASGAILYTVSYLTGDPQNIINLIDQTKNASLKLTFQGADKANNIYIYDSFLYHVVFHLNYSQTTGTVDITQKQIFVQ